jgi:hypothetical protein
MSATSRSGGLYGTDNRRVQMTAEMRKIRREMCKQAASAAAISVRSTAGAVDRPHCRMRVFESLDGARRLGMMMWARRHIAVAHRPQVAAQCLL